MNITADALIAKCQRNIPDLGQRVEDSDWFFYFTEAIRRARAGRTLPWQKRTTSMEFFTNIFEYPLPSDIDSFIKPHKDMLVSTDEGPFLLYGRDKDFFANNNYSLGIKWERDVRTLLAKQESAAMVLMDGFGDDATEYDLTGDANTPVSDSIRFKEGAASLRFNITSSSGSAIISRTLGSKVDLTEYLNKGYGFLWLDMPTVVDSVTIRYGSSDTDYYEVQAVAVDFFGNAFTAGKFNILQFDMKNAVITGSPDITAIDRYVITMTETVTDTDFRIDAFTFHIPSLLELPYNSKNVVKDNSGDYQESVTAGSDTILTDETYEAAFMYDAIENAATFKLRDTDLIVLAKSKKDERYIDLNRRYPSVEALAQSNYYSKYNRI